MMTITKRPYIPKEVSLLRSQKIGYWDYAEGFFLRLLLLSMPLIILILIFNGYIQKIPSHIETVILLAGLSFLIIYSIKSIYKREYQSNKDLEFEVKNGEATIYTIKTKVVIIREEYADLGLTYYIELTNNKILYLRGLYIGDYGIDIFPLSEFEIIRGGSLNQILDINPIGTYLEPLKILAALNPKEFQNYPYKDGDIINLPIHEIL